MINIDQIYLINLDRRPDRLSHCEKQFIKSDIIKNGYQKYIAIDGALLDDETIKALVTSKGYEYITSKQPTKGLYLSRGAVGLALTYKRIFEICVDENILLLEDDIILKDNFDSILLNGLNDIPNDWDIIYLGWYKSQNLKIEPITSVIGEITGQINGTQGWIINPRSASKLLNLFPLSYQIDTAIYRAKNLKKYCFIDPIITRYNSKSDIQ